MPPASALLERILAEGYIPGMARAAGIAGTVVVELDSSPIVKVVAPRRFAIPRPQKPRGHYLKILEWEEGGQEKTAPLHGGGYEPSKYEYLRHGGAYVQRLLAQSRALATLLRATTEGCEAYDVPQWPPAPKQVEETSTPKPAVFSMAPQTTQESGRSCGTAMASSEVPAGFFVGRDGLVWPLPPSECMTTPVEDYLRGGRPDLRWGETPVPATTSPTVEGELVDASPDPKPTLGFREDIEWPLPSMGSAARKLLATSRSTPDDTARPESVFVSSTSRNYDGGRTTGPKARPGFFIGRQGLEWPLPPPECVDPAVLEAYRSLSRTSYSSATCTASSCQEEVRVSPASSWTTTSTESTFPVTPQVGTLGLGGGMLGVGGASPTPHTIATILVGTLLAPQSVSRRLDKAHASRARSWSPIVEDDFFIGWDDNVRSFTPSDDEYEMEDRDEERRGRSPTPKWSMLRA